jgi:hypothetical protein
VTAVFTSAEQVPYDVTYLADGNNVLFARDEDELDLWCMLPLTPGFAMPLGGVFSRFGDLRQVDHVCDACDERPATGMCCSSHQAHMCHRCYRLAHFVEVCVAGCSDCAREGLAVRDGAA